jgi:rhodanese-related sulfurtransferase
VRTAHEFDAGKIKGSINIPVDRLDINLERIRGFRKPVIVVCDNGARSQQAISILKRNSIKDVHYGGSWTRVLRMIKSL